MVKHRGFNIYIEEDHCTGDSPRDWDPISTFASWSAEIRDECPERPTDEEIFGTEPYTIAQTNKEIWEARMTWYVTNLKIVAILPLYGGYGANHNVYTTSHGRQVGFTYMTREMFTRNYSDEWIEQFHKGKTKGSIARDVLKSELKTFTQWKNGEVYGYRIEGLADTCWGFYGDDHEESGLLAEARGAIKWEIKNRTIHHCKRLKNMIKNKVELNKRIPYGYS